MNDTLKSKLGILAQDDLLIQAIKTVFLASIDKEKPKIGNNDNQLIGEQYRSYEVAKEIIDDAFNTITNLKVSPKKQGGFNKEE